MIILKDRKINAICVLLALLFIVRAVHGSDYKSTSGPTDTKFIRAKGNKLVIGKNDLQVFLRGINIQNFWLVDRFNPDVWIINDSDNIGIPVRKQLPWRYGENAMKNIAGIGMNVVRNEIHYRWFEDDRNPHVYKEEGFRWLDEDITLAKENGLYTIIDLHVPQGGLQSSSQLGASAALWENPELQNRVILLWRKIARRYRDDPRIAAYDLINEPSPSRSPHQWAIFAQELVNEIRKVDPNHLIIIEEITSVVSPEGEYPEIDPYDPWLPLVDDNNIMYDLHFYNPAEYTGQGRPEVSGKKGGIYPDLQKEYRDHAGTLIGVFNKKGVEKFFLERMKRFEEHNGVSLTNYPINIGEFSPSRITFLNNNEKGGITYLGDLLDIFERCRVNYQFFSYLGIFFEEWEYQEEPELKDINRKLIILFQHKLLGKQAI